MAKYEFGEKESELYTPGDLIWGKLDSWAYWPCLVTYCPATGAYVRFGLDKSKPEITECTLISYHVQYFGPRVYHGWTTPGNINSLPFLGLQDYMDKLEVWKLQARDEDMEVRKLAQSYVRRLTVGHKPKSKGWEAAVKEAEEALNYDCKVKRFSNLVYQFKEEHSSNEKCDGSKNTKDNSVIGTECYICQMDFPDITCSLACSKSYHLECLGLKRKPKVAFRCVSCMADTKCRMCEGNKDVIKCSLSTCPTYFHEECLAPFLYLRKEQNLCPNHLEAKFDKLPRIKLLKMNLKEDTYLLKDSHHATYLDKNNQVQRAIYIFKELNIAVLPADAKCIEISSEFEITTTFEPPSDIIATELIHNEDPTEAEKSIHVKEQENITTCFVCKKPGKIMCSKEGCCKYYDDQCAKLQGTPEGDWTCMVHTCCICKGDSCVYCITCPTSFCANCWYQEVPESYQCEICRIKHRNF